MTEHIVRAFEEELVSLGEKIAHMGGLAEKQLAEAIESLSRRDGDLAEVVIAADKRIDQFETEIEEQAILMIARRQPMALDLREIMAAIKISTDLERIGDLSKNIAKRVLALGREVHPKRLIRGVEHMSRLSQEQLKRVLDSYSQRDGDTGHRIVAVPSRGLEEGRAGAGGEAPETYGDDDLVGLERGLQRPLEEVGRRDLACPPHGGRLDDGTGQDGDRGHLTGGVGVGDRAHRGAPVADRRVRHAGQRLPEQGQGRGGTGVGEQAGVPHQGAHPDVVVADLDPVAAGQAVDVDQVIG